jgi:transposase
MYSNGIPTGETYSGPQELEQRPNSEVIPEQPRVNKRRKFSDREKLRVLDEIDGLPDGEIGTYLRKNGLYSSHVSAWAKLRKAGKLGDSEARSRGRKKSEPPAQLEQQVTLLQKELDIAREQLRQATLILEIQKKVLSLSAEPAPSSLKASCARRLTF